MDNRVRILAVLAILNRYSDDEHFISAPFIMDKLKSEYDLTVGNRKTIYSDIKALQEIGFEIEYNDSYANLGYGIYGYPFNLAEVKIMEDMLNSFRPFDEHSTETLIKKLHQFISLDNQKFLKAIAIDSKKKDSHLIYSLETILKAIHKEETLKIYDKNGESEIVPYLLNYTNNNYYLYYEYNDNGKAKIYHKRLDRLKKVDATNVKHLKPMRYAECRKLIAESYDAFTGSEIEEIVLDCEANYVLEDLKDSFEMIVFRDKRAYLKTRISDNLFGKLCGYGTDIKIVGPESFKKAYLEHLKKTINQYD